MTGKSSHPILRFQYAQQEHDRRSHNDILALSPQDRMQHYALHMAKYTRDAMIAAKTSDDALLRRRLTDQFIITLAAANVLGERGLPIHTDPRLHAPGAKTLRALARTFNTESQGTPPLPDGYPFQAAWETLTDISGRMAKTSEDIDHFVGNPAASYQSLLAESARSTLRLMSAAGMDPDNAVRNKWKKIEAGHFLNGTRASTILDHHI